jgi:hypothetical protein
MGIEKILFLTLGILSILMAVLGGIVSSKEPWIRGAFIVMGVASVVCVVWEGRIMQPQATPAQIAAALSPLLGGKNTGIPTSAPARDIAILPPRL